MYIIFDTETTGLPRRWDAPLSDTNNWPRVVQLAWQLHDEWGQLVEAKNFIIRPEGFTIPYNAEKIHGISTERALKQGMPLDFVLGEFNKSLEKATFAVGHNINFDINTTGGEFYRTGIETKLGSMASLDSCSEASAELCKLPGGRGNRFKLPTLTELHQFLFKEGFSSAHNASADVEATTRCFLELIRIGLFDGQTLSSDPRYLEEFQKRNPEAFELIGLNIEPYCPHDLKDKNEGGSQNTQAPTGAPTLDLSGIPYCHLHNHTQYSILQATTEISYLIDWAVKEKMPAVGITDLGNMYTAFEFTSKVADANKKIKEQNAKIEAGEAEGEIQPPLKSVVGCEFYVAENYTQRKFTKDSPDRRFTQVLFAKNKNGYHNLAKLCSFGWVDGLYGIYPRIGKGLIAQYKQDVIATTGNLSGEIPNLILNIGESQAEEAFRWWYELFGEDFYVELQRHGLPEEQVVNDTLMRFAQKYGVKYIAQNNTYYSTREEAKAHDVLLCIGEGEFQSTPIGRGRGFRFGFPNDEFYVKSQAEMKELFRDIPQAVVNLQEVVDKIENFTLYQDILLPAFDIPQEFKDPEDEKNRGKRGENAYLRHLTYIGAKERYGDPLDGDTRQRIDFELETIAKTGYPGYFLIVQDFTSAARKMGVSVGPGRGSAAGSAVAYCIGITAIDPIKYDLLFERFLNPERVSLPDIDIDFDDEGRGRIIDWVVQKYGQNQVAQIITYGTMAAKSSIRDTGRVLEMSPSEVNEIAKLVPDIKLNKLFSLTEAELCEKLKNKTEEIEKAHTLKEMSQNSDLTARIINQAKVIEGSVRNTGIHACGVIITPSDIREHVPVAVAKDSELLVTQFDNKYVESAGLLKMDFLGLKTLSLIKDTLTLVKQRFGIEINSDNIPLDDVKTYELFQRGETIGVFQYESPGMQKYMRELRPTEFSDLIAMNALYRPGPIEYIPDFIKRKHGLAPIVYDLPDMEEYLKETYGITVYQEQVMLLSQKLAGFTKGEADVLRKAMGKKLLAVLAKMKPKFVDHAIEKGHDKKILEKIWTDWEAFASYAFNKSHSTCYAWVAYQTAYLKANFPSEYMASVLSNNMKNLDDVKFFMEECRRMGIRLLCPDVNESQIKFTVNKAGDIRFGMGAIKNVGENAIAAILKEREENGPFTSIFDFTKRVDTSACGRRVIENLVIAGAFDSFGYNRSQYFYDDGKMTVIEKAVRFGISYKEAAASAQASLFGEMEDNTHGGGVTEPAIPPAQEWPTMEKLKKEEEVVGLFISGHPLDEYEYVLKYYCNVTLERMKDLNALIGQELYFGGIITQAEARKAQSGNDWGIFTIQDKTDKFTFRLFNEDFLKFRAFLDVDRYVFFRCKVHQPYQRKDGSMSDARLQFHNVQLLGTVPESEQKKVKLAIDIENLSEGLIANIKKHMEAHPGNNSLEFSVFDRAKNINLVLCAPHSKIAINGTMLEYLDKELPEVEYFIK